jgi:secondary thiamine-phosphate synthase enzyme
MTIIQRSVTLGPFPRGVHCITDAVVERLPELHQFTMGVAQLFLQHTSAALTLGENTDPDVRSDLDEHLERLVPDDLRFYRHRIEGADDASSHIKSVLVGSTLSIPIRNGNFMLGRWQGIYLCEFRAHASARTIVVTLIGERQ